MDFFEKGLDHAGFFLASPPGVEDPGLTVPDGCSPCWGPRSETLNTLRNFNALKTHSRSILEPSRIYSG